MWKASKKVEKLYERLHKLPVEFQLDIIKDMETALENRIKVFENIDREKESLFLVHIS